MSAENDIQFTVIAEEDPDSGDLMLPFPEDFLMKEDWRLGDRLRLEVVAERRFVLTNLSKAERKS